MHRMPLFEKVLAALTVAVFVNCWADGSSDLLVPLNAAPTTLLDPAHAFVGQDAVTIEADRRPGNYSYQLDAAPLILQSVHFEGEVHVASGTSVALNAFVVARRGRSPLDFVNLVEHPITSEQPGWVPFALDLPVPPTSQTVRLGFSVTGEGQVSVRHIVINNASEPIEPLAPEPEAYLLAALKDIHDSSLKRDSIDWQQLRDYLLSKAQHAQRSSDTYDALRVALRLLADRHSRLLLPEEVQQLMSEGAGHTPEVKFVSHQIATLTIPAFGGLSPQAAQRYMQAAALPLARAARKARCGWVIDLRGDSGGDLWPTLGVVAPFLRSGTLGAFNYPDHIDLWRLQHGVLFDGSRATVTALTRSVTLQQAKIAVLIGANTTSSGEALAIALHGRPDTRFFGAQSGGLATSVDFDLLSDGAALLVTAALDADRFGMVFADGLEPDQLIEQPKADAPDRTMLAAKSWLQAQCRH